MSGLLIINWHFCQYINMPAFCTQFPRFVSAEFEIWQYPPRYR